MNLQRVKALINGEVRDTRVSTYALKKEARDQSAKRTCKKERDQSERASRKQFSIKARPERLRFFCNALNTNIY